jgi:hypothetical protein
MATTRRRRSASRRATSAGERARHLHLPALFLAFAGVSLLVYRGAIGGPFLSDDVPYIAANPYVQGLSAENLAAILDPTGPTIPLAANYSPVHLLLHALEWQLFESDVRGYHLINVLLHAFGSAMLGLLLRRSGLPPLAAMGGAAFFLLHPANVEAVAWISQLKTTSAFALAVGALLAHPRRPLLGTVLFALALLAKPLAARAARGRGARLGAGRADLALDGRVGAGLRWCPRALAFRDYGKRLPRPPRRPSGVDPDQRGPGLAVLRDGGHVIRGLRLPGATPGPLLARSLVAGGPFGAGRPRLAHALGAAAAPRRGGLVALGGDLLRAGLADLSSISPWPIATCTSSFRA